MSDTTEPKKAWVGYKSRVVWTVWLFSGFGLLLHFFPLDLEFPSFTSGPSRTVLAPAQPEKPPAYKQEAKVIRLDLDPEQWSDWVDVPEGYTSRISRPNCWEQYWFKGEAGPRARLEPGTRTDYSDVSPIAFKLRGTKGPVGIIIEPK